jgi:hypothetical protein
MWRRLPARSAVTSHLVPDLLDRHALSAALQGDDTAHRFPAANLAKGI